MQSEPYIKSNQLNPIVAPTIDVNRYNASLARVAAIAYRCVRVLVSETQHSNL